MAIPVANFNWAPTNNTVSFTDTSTNTPTSWAWTFGDGGTSTSQNPSHTYASAGTANAVHLTATNASGSNTTAQNVIVNWAIFTSAPDPQTLSTNVSFTETTDPYVLPSAFASWTRSWAFGDGGTSTSQNPTHAYVADGTYTVQLTIVVGADTEGLSDPPTTAQRTRVAGANHTYVATLDVHIVAPVAAFTVDPKGLDSAAPLVLGNVMNFIDQSTGSPSTWDWDFGDGNTSSSQNPSHTYSASGTYTVTLTVT